MAKRYIYVKKKYILLFSIVDFIGTVVFSLVNFFKRDKQNFDIKKIAVIELAHIGDVLAITPALHLLKKKFPSASITSVLSPWCRDIITGNPDVNDIILYRAPWFDRIDRTPFSLFETLSFIRLMRSKRFDLGIDMRGDFRTILLMWLSGIRRRIGYAFAGGGFLLTDTIPFNVEKRQDRHQVDHNLDLIDSISWGQECSDKDKSLKILFSDRDSEYIDNFLKKERIIKYDFLIAIHPGGALPAKRWPVEKFALLMEEISKKYNIKIILIGGGEEKVLATRLRSLTSAEFIDAVGKTSIKQLAALLRRCNLFIGGDSGAMHIASAAKVPIVTIWGGHNKPSHWRPLAERDIVIHKQVDCSPCGLDYCSRLKCLKQISVEDVLDGVEKQIEKEAINYVL